MGPISSMFLSPLGFVLASEVLTYIMTGSLFFLEKEAVEVGGGLEPLGRAVVVPLLEHAAVTALCLPWLQPGHARRSPPPLRTGEPCSCRRIFLRGIQVNRAGKPNATCAAFGLFADI